MNTKMVLTFLLLTVVLFLTNTHGQEILVDLPEGKIAGHTLKSFLGNPFYAFQEVPYAAPPVGDLRFALPQNPQPWNGVLNTTHNTKQCIQGGTTGYNDPTVDQSEDCLYLNVYTPQVPGGSQRLPVYVWIHGGGFTSGTGTFNFVNPSRFMDYGILVVTINYRLAALGFLTTGDGVIPDNLGLKDQRFALRWVKSHIELFGGDPDKITIGGESSGSRSMGYHLLSQNSDGLFNAVIMQSGSPLSPICFKANPRDTAFRLGNALDPSLNLSNSNDLLDLLRRTSADHIVNASLSMVHTEHPAAGYSTWLPVIEYAAGQDPFLTTLMHDSFLHGNFHHVPVLMGYNSEEALIYADKVIGTDLGGFYDKNIAEIIDKRLMVPAEKRTFLAKEMKKFYTNSTFSEDHAALIKMLTDARVTTGMLRQAELSSHYTSVYFYQFSYMGVLGETIKQRNNVPGAVGVQHGEELGYLFDAGVPSDTNANDFLTMERLLKLWANFIKYQNPTPELDPILGNVTWPKVEASHIQYLNINSTLEVQSNPRRYSDVSALLLQFIQQPYTLI